MNGYELEQSFDEMLDDCYPVIKIGEMTFSPSQVLKNCDPVAYRVSVSDYEDFLAENEDGEDEE